MNSRVKRFTYIKIDTISKAMFTSEIESKCQSLAFQTWLSPHEIHVINTHKEVILGQFVTQYNTYLNF